MGMLDFEVLEREFDQQEVDLEMNFLLERKPSNVIYKGEFADFEGIAYEDLYEIAIIRLATKQQAKFEIKKEEEEARAKGPIDLYLGRFTKGNHKDRLFEDIIKEDPSYLYYLYTNNYGGEALKQKLADTLHVFCSEGRDAQEAETKRKYKLKCGEVKGLKAIISYLESLIEFCAECKNPKDDCIC